MNALDRTLGTFGSWYDRLRKNKAAGSVVPVSGLSLGLAVVRTSPFMPKLSQEHIVYVGLRMVDVSALVFLVNMIGLTAIGLYVQWLSANKPKTANPTKVKPPTVANTRPKSG